MTVWADVALVLAFVLVGGLFAGAEMALVSLRPGQVSRLAQQGRRGRGGLEPRRGPQPVPVRGADRRDAGRLLLLGGRRRDARPAGGGAAPERGVAASLANTVALVAVTVVVAYVSLVLGELAPKRIALQRAESIATACRGPRSTRSPGSPGR